MGFFQHSLGPLGCWKNLRLVFGNGFVAGQRGKFGSNFLTFSSRTDVVVGHRGSEVSQLIFIFRPGSFPM